MVHTNQYQTGTERQVTLQPLWGPFYNMSKEEPTVLRKELSEILDKAFIRVSSSSAAGPVLFSRKPGRGLCFCIGYRRLIPITSNPRDAEPDWEGQVVYQT